MFPNIENSQIILFCPFLTHVHYIWVGCSKPVLFIDITPIYSGPKMILCLDWRFQVIFIRSYGLYDLIQLNDVLLKWNPKFGKIWKDLFSWNILLTEAPYMLLSSISSFFFHLT